MARHRRLLPQLDANFLTDSGLETDLIFHHGVDLPCFAAFPLLDSPTGRDLLARYYLEHAAIAAEHGVGFVFEAPTWRASPGWGLELGYDQARIVAINEYAIAFMDGLRHTSGLDQAVTSGQVGPRGDGYRPGIHMPTEVARDYHRVQIEAFARADADLVTAMTLSYADEAIGIVQAAAELDIVSVISFTVETDGRLPDGTALAEAIGAVDDATDGEAAYFMINCAHPSHIEPALASTDPRLARIRGLRANSSRRSHAELDDAPVIDEGDPEELAAEYRKLREQLDGLTVLGGCCGTDLRHVRAIADACL